MSTLEILNGKRQGEVIELADATLSIGNKKTSGISIRDPWISYKHARLGVDDGKYWIEDLGSTNKTWVNGNKLEEKKRHYLSDGDMVHFGKTRSKFSMSVSSAALGGAAVVALKEERDELERMKNVLERFLDVDQSERDKVLASVKRPEPITDNSAVEAAQKRASELEAQLEAARAEQGGLEDKLVNTQREAEDAVKAVAAAEKSSQDSNERVSELENEANQAREASEQLAAQVAEQEARVQQLESDKGALDQKIEGLELELKQKSEALEGAASESEAEANANLLAQTKHLEDRIAQKDQALEEANRQRQSLMAKTVELENETAATRKKFDQQSNLVTELKGNLSKEVEKVQGGFDRQLLEKDRAIEDAERARSNAEKQAAELTTQLEAAQTKGQDTSELQAAQSALAEAHATIAKLQASAGDDAGDQTATLERLTNERDMAFKDREKSMGEMQDMNDELDKISHEQIELEEEIERLKAENDSLKKSTKA
jgi:pSer/pThr/pTyr-binding forkhead associated (FHA) protein